MQLRVKGMLVSRNSFSPVPVPILAANSFSYAVRHYKAQDSCHASPSNTELSSLNKTALNLSQDIVRYLGSVTIASSNGFQQALTGVC
jgi:hypothetical protein